MYWTNGSADVLRASLFLREAVSKMRFAWIFVKPFQALVLWMNESRRWAVCLCALLAITITCGCSTFAGRDAATASYEQTRRQMVEDANRSFSPATYETEPDSQAPLSIESFSPTNLSNTVRDLAGFGPDANKARKAMEESEAVYNNAFAF